MPEPNTGCWLWTAVTNNHGYGVFWSEGKNLRAHRVSWELHNTTIPKQKSVLHKCDNTFCVNPEHLYLGTQKNNVDDMVNRKRHAIQQKTHCKNGHFLGGKNLYLCPRGYRECRLCRKNNLDKYKKGRV